MTSLDEAARMNIMHHIVEQTLHLYHVLDTWHMYIMTSLDEATRMNIMHHISDAQADA